MIEWRLANIRLIMNTRNFHIIGTMTMRLMTTRMIVKIVIILYLFNWNVISCHKGRIIIYFFNLILKWESWLGMDNGKNHIPTLINTSDFKEINVAGKCGFESESFLVFHICLYLFSTTKIMIFSDNSKFFYINNLYNFFYQYERTDKCFRLWYLCRWYSEWKSHTWWTEGLWWCLHQQHPSHYLFK